MHPFEHVASLLIWQLKADFSPSRTVKDIYRSYVQLYIYILIIYNLLLHDICLSHFISIFPILCGELRFLWTELPNHMTFLLLSVWLDFSGAVGIKRKTWLCALISPPINKHQDYLFSMFMYHSCWMKSLYWFVFLGILKIDKARFLMTWKSTTTLRLCAA